MVRRGRLLLWTLIGVGTAARLVLAFATNGVEGDLETIGIVDRALRADPINVYDQVNQGFPRWPYAPGFFPWVLASGGLARGTGLAIDSLSRLPAIACDAGLAWLVYDHLGHRGLSTRSRLLGAGLVALGPSLAAISGFHGHFDSVAILPAAAALVLWERTDATWRPYAVGGLVGLGGAVKTVPLLMLLALLPSARSAREAVTLAAVALAIPGALLAPFAIFGDGGTRSVFSYHGGPGLGGLSLLAAPDAPAAAFGIGPGTLTGLARDLYDSSRFILGGALFATVAFVLRHKPRPTDAACLVWLAVYVFGVTFYLQYMVWGLPFFILAGYLREALALQVALIPPTLVAYVVVPAALDGAAFHRWEISAFYTAPLLCVLAGFAAGLFLLARRIARESPRTAAAVP